MFIVGFFSGNIEQKKGWVAGMTTALVIIILFILVKLFAHTSLTFEMVLKYLAFLLLGALGGMIGVNIRPLIRRNLTKT